MNIYQNTILNHFKNRICGIIVSVLASCVDRWCKSRSSQSNICCFYIKHTTQRSKNKDWLARNQTNMSEWDYMSTHGLLFQCASIIKIQLSVLVKYKADTIIIIVYQNVRIVKTLTIDPEALGGEQALQTQKQGFGI